MIRRLDDRGYLYFMDYTGDYYDPELVQYLKEITAARAGCSSFLTHNENGDVLTCRNYDMGHRVSADDPAVTGLNVILHCKPAGKYESIGVADAVWIKPFDPLCQAGGPEKEGFTPKLFKSLPYLSVDGVNEKGLSVTTLKVDIKEGDQPARERLAPGFFLRHLLDNCANVAEAAELAQNGEVRSEGWQDCHFFVSDANGDSILLESRNGQLYVVSTDIATNFFQCSADIEDSYFSDGALREKAVYMTGLGENRYTYGYGHGYHRFVSIQTQLEMHRNLSSEAYRTVMPEDRALVILRSVAQNACTKAVGFSHTQYSVIYNNTAKTLKAWPFQDYSKGFCFDVTGKELP